MLTRRILRSPDATVAVVRQTLRQHNTIRPVRTCTCVWSSTRSHHSSSNVHAWRPTVLRLTRTTPTAVWARSPSGRGDVGRRLLSTEMRAAIDRAVSSAPVVLFMKGTPEMPQCGFSRATVQILGLQGVDPSKFAAFNVLEDQDLRAGIKEYSDWPTIPQLYVAGEFVGGCDIVMSMHQSGDLAKLLEEKGVLVPAEEREAVQEAVDKKD